jgi:hypothetical protein
MRQGWGERWRSRTRRARRSFVRWRRGSRRTGRRGGCWPSRTRWTARPGGETAFALVLPTVNTDTMQILLDRFAETLAEDEHAVFVRETVHWTAS